MRQIVLVVPDWVGLPETEDILRQKLESLSQFAEMGQVARLFPDPPVETPEALYLGMAPNEVNLRQGPLTVSALGADPPERSTHFHLSLLGFENDRIKLSNLMPTDGEVRGILEAATKLNRKRLTLVKGEGRDHALVWEGRGDMATVSVLDADGKDIQSVLPQGDADLILRQYIDDSVNLLSELEINKIRVQEGIPQVNLLWPWGDGTRTRVPNLALRRGVPAIVMSNSLRMQGLSRLVGYRPMDRQRLRTGINLNFELIRKELSSENTSIIFIDTFTDLRANEMIEEAAWFTRRIEDELFSPLLEQMKKEPMHLTLISSSLRGVGLSLQLNSQSVKTNTLPSTSEQSKKRGCLWERVGKRFNRILVRKTRSMGNLI